MREACDKHYRLSVVRGQEADFLPSVTYWTAIHADEEENEDSREVSDKSL